MVLFQVTQVMEVFRVTQEVFQVTQVIPVKQVTQLISSGPNDCSGGPKCLKSDQVTVHLTTGFFLFVLY